LSSIQIGCERLIVLSEIPSRRIAAAIFGSGCWQMQVTTKSPQPGDNGQGAAGT
jgi:hypothetical protein